MDDYVVDDQGFVYRCNLFGYNRFFIVSSTFQCMIFNLIRHKECCHIELHTAKGYGKWPLAQPDAITNYNSLRVLEWRLFNMLNCKEFELVPCFFR